MLDQIGGNQEVYFSTIFSFFAPENEFSKWDLETSRKNMSDYWKDHGQIQTSEKTTWVEIQSPDGNPVYLYYLRQNPITKQLYYITYHGISTISFCRLTSNEIFKNQ
jgi:hypothetical protein